MIFNSFNFIWLFPIIFFGYYFIVWLFVKRGRAVNKLANALLLILSYALYAQHAPKFTLVLLGVTAITYFGALLIERRHAYGKKKYIIFAGSLLALLPLLVFKYADFVCEIFTGVHNGLDLAVPMGISFFTFQAVGYLFDVYYQRIKAERNWWDYMLFVSFFPQILAGPISKAKDLLPQIKAERRFDYGKVVQGSKWLLWGMFLKVVMADNLGLYVDSVFNNYEYNSGASCLFASVCYSFQIYGDFAGYSLMAIGVGRMMGFDLINNFNRPYLSRSVTEFWHRWHISLSLWLKDYVYIPLGGNRCGKLRCYWNILVTFLVSGIWHGANWTYILWGVLHGVLQIMEKILGIQKCDSKKLIVVMPRILVTFILVTFAWLFFRMPTVDAAWTCVVKIFTDFGTPYLPIKEIMYSVAVIFVVSFSEIWSEVTGKQGMMMYSRYVAVRWFSYVALIISIVLFGVLESGDFIYVSF